VLTIRQQRIWADTEVLFKHMIAELGDDPCRGDIEWRLAKAYNIRGDTYASRGDFSNALTDYGQAIQHAEFALTFNPANIRAIFFKGHALMKIADASPPVDDPVMAQARIDSYLAAAQTLAPIADTDGSPGTIEMVGVALTKANRLPEAEGAFRHAVQRFPNASMLWLRLAQVVFLQGRQKEAREMLAAATQRDPALAPAAQRVLDYWAAVSTVPAPTTAPSGAAATRRAPATAPR
jgi:tetratricopeptide (TPR) repeat protein